MQERGRFFLQTKDRAGMSQISSDYFFKSGNSLGEIDFSLFNIILLHQIDEIGLFHCSLN